MILLRSVVSKEPALLFGMFNDVSLWKNSHRWTCLHMCGMFLVLLAGTQLSLSCLPPPLLAAAPSSIQLRMEQPPTVVVVDRRGLLVLGRCFDF